VLLHRGLGRRLVHALKYEKASYLAADVGKLLTTQPYYKRLAWFLQDVVLVPVPLHPCKVRERGFNQSELIAKECALHLPAQGLSCLLQRHRLTTSQTSLPRTKRLQNVRGAFSLKQQAKPLCPQARYVLVDDVFTTGATLDACARVLKKHGATRVDVFTLSHG
jgi:ComF family protein